MVVISSHQSVCVGHLLPALKDLDHTISANVVQILMLLYHTFQIASASSDPDHPADVLGRPRV